IRSCSPATPPANTTHPLFQEGPRRILNGSKFHGQHITLPQEVATNPRYSTEVIYQRRPDPLLILGTRPR
ncbi:hypothetical protein LINPERHAP2_LOCUS3129, partial [Linum perenne]